MAEWRFVPDSTVEVCSDGRVRRDGVERVPCNANGYQVTRINGRLFRLHRLIAIAFIPNPVGKPCVDHIDGDPLNNHISNLRWATYAENNRNTRCIMREFPRGVRIRGERFRARIHYGGNEIPLGTYDTPEAASAAYEAKAKELFGEFYNTTVDVTIE